MKFQRREIVSVAAALALLLGTVLIAKATTPPFEPSAVQYQGTASHTTTTAVTTTGTTATQTANTTDMRWDLNTVTHDQLTQIKGIGDVMADRILLYREQHGGFDTVEELLNVNGVAQKRFEQWKDHFYIGTPYRAE